MANVSSNNLTTLYSGGGVNLRPTSAYGNANVVALLNAGTDGANTVANIVATGNITANNFIGNFIGNATNANFANYAGNVTVSAQPNITSLGTLVNVSATGNITSVSGVFVGNGAGLTNINGANVSAVANANYASYANIANVANSVAVANVVGIGNIATINLDGSSSNVLFGNGVFAPESTSIANANYANFAGNALVLANGTSNVSIPVANGTIAFSVNNVANVTMLENGGFMNTFPTSSIVNMMRINTFNNSLSDAHRVAWARARGTNASPTSVQANDRLGILSFFGHNGTNYQTNSVGFLRAIVDSSYTTNDANIPIGIQVLVNDTNGNINNQTKTHNFWANGNVTFANSVFVTDSLSVTGNITSGNANLGNLVTANFFTGDGGLLSNIIATSGASITNGNSNVVVTANANILISTAGNANVVDIFASGTVNLKPPPQGPLNALRIETYGRSGNTGAQRISSTRFRGNSTTPLGVQPGDFTMELITLASNGTAVQSNSLAFIRAQVGSSYTANSANIPLGWQVVVNDTNGGINNQTKTHNFYSNGQTALSGNLSASSLYISNNAGANVADIQVIGDKTIFSGITIKNGQYRVIEDNVDPSTGFTPLSVGLYSANNSIPSNRFFRGGNTEASPTGVVAGDQINIINYGAYGDSGNTYVNVFDAPRAVVTGNDGAGNVTANLEFFAFNNGSNIVFTSTNTYASGNLIVSGNLSVTGTANIGNITTANVTTANITTANIGNLQLNLFQEDVYAIGSTSGTITPDFNNGSIQSMTLTGSITMNSLANAIAGRSMTLVITQGGSGGYTLTSSMKFSNGYKTLSTGVGAIDIISVFYDGSTYYSSLTNGYA
jgi:hypothetical protein